MATVTLRGATYAFSLAAVATSMEPRTSQQVTAMGHPIAIVGATVLTMTSQGELPAHTVVVRNDSIVAVGPAASTPVPTDAQWIDGRGRYLIPGLIDMHVHLASRNDLDANLRHGVTAVVQMSDARGSIADFLALRDEISRGETAGPRLFLTGPMFDVPGLARNTTAYAYPDSAAAARLMARHAAQGYDFFKVHNRTPRGVYDALTSAALPVIGHVPMDVPLETVLDSDQAMVAHAELFYWKEFVFPVTAGTACRAGFWECAATARADTGVIPALAARVRAADVAVTANLAYLRADERAYREFSSLLNDPEFARLDPQLQAAWRADAPERRSSRQAREQVLAQSAPFTRALVARLDAAGVPIVAGTDAPLTGVFPGRALHEEMAQLVETGLATRAALGAATSVAGAFLQRHVPRSRVLGRIVVGGAADLVLLRRNPLADIAATREIIGVVSHGQWRAR